MGATVAAAQTVTLEQAVGAAAMTSPTVLREDATVQRAEGQLQQARGAFDWNAQAESGWERLYVPEERNGFLTTDTHIVDGWRTTLGVGKMFRNGVSVQPGVTFYSDVDASVGQTLGLTQTRPVLNLTVPIFRGYGEDSAAASNERAAQSALEGSRLGRAFAEQRAVFDAAVTFWRCLAAARQLQTLQARQMTTDAEVEALRMQVQSGTAEQTALDRAVANQAVQQSAVAATASADQSCRRDLAQTMGLPPEADPPQVTGEFPEFEPLADEIARLNGPALVQAAVMRRQDLQAMARYDLAQSERLRGARDGLLPRVDVNVDTTRVMLRLSQSLGRDIAEGQVAEAVAAQSEARLNRQQLERQIRRDVEEQLTNLRVALTNLTALARSATLLANVVADAEQRFQAGVITLAEYRAIQAELTQAERQVIDARLQFASSLAGLRLATGTITAGEGAAPAVVAVLFRTLPEN
jgi:outer membrane protein TolC